ncbi:ParA family protein [Kineococcus rhizosphaerae]|uniref:ParA family protein n=1 Tax=Kineococcus rhizosphaerae TaxID=559628 RepID=UPI0014735938|nr:ParA family protein [Kineococcus rhizosphaerae]
MDELLAFVEEMDAGELSRWIDSTDRAILRLLMDRVVAIINNKGGVLKTSIATNLAGQLAAAGTRVLLLDLDRQGNCAQDLGYGTDARDDKGLGIVQAVLGSTALLPIRNVRPNLDVVPGGKHLDNLRALLTAQRSQSRHAAADALVIPLAHIARDYEVILLDCPPGEPIVQEVAVGVARWLLVPVRSDASSRAGMSEVAERVETVREVNPDVELLGVLLTGTSQSATRIHERVYARVREDLGPDAYIFKSRIRYAEAAASDSRERGELAHELEKVVSTQPAWYEAMRSGQPVERLAGSASSLAGDYAALAQEFVQTLLEAESEGAADDEGASAGEDDSANDSVNEGAEAIDQDDSGDHRKQDSTSGGGESATVDGRASGEGQGVVA